MNAPPNLCFSHCTKHDIFQCSPDLFLYTKKAHNGKLHYLCSVILGMWIVNLALWKQYC